MIGLFNECFPPVMDGVSLTVSNLARCFYKQGKDVAVVTPEMPGLDESQLPYSVFQYRSFRFPVAILTVMASHRSISSSRSRLQLRILKSYMRIVRFLRAISP